MTDEYGLIGFDEEAKPSSGFSNKLEDIPDGEYQFLITKAEMRKNASAGYSILDMTLRVLDGDRAGTEGSKPVFFKEQQNVNIFMGELRVLGFDVDNWTVAKQRPFSSELVKARLQLPGLAFKGKKKKSKDGVHINIEVKELIGRREIPGAAAAAAAAAAKNDPF